MRSVGVRRALLGTTLLLLSCGVTVFIGSAVAYAEGCGTFQNLQVGWASNQGATQTNTYEGSAVNLTDRGGYALCTTDTNPANFSTSWVMIFGGNGYAQAGTMYRWGYSCVKRWAQQAPPGGSFQNFEISGCSTVGETHRYWNQSIYISSAWHMRSNIDTTVIRESTFSPFSWTMPLQVAYDSETYYAQTHVPGTTASPQDYNAMQVQLNNTSNNFVTTCNYVSLGSLNGNPGRWGVSAPSCSHTQSWTK